MTYEVMCGDCEQMLQRGSLSKIPFFQTIDLTFLDPPFNQAKYYASHNDDMPEVEYWTWMKRILCAVYDLTTAGGAVYFMQREKNAERVLLELVKLE